MIFKKLADLESCLASAEQKQPTEKLWLTHFSVGDSFLCCRISPCCLLGLISTAQTGGQKKSISDNDSDNDLY